MTTSEYFSDSSPNVTVAADFNISIKVIASIRYAAEISEQGRLNRHETSFPNRGIKVLLPVWVH